MNHLTLYIGIEKDGSGKQIDPQARSNAIQSLRELAVRRFGGYTLTHCQGGWLGPKGIVEEGSIRLDIYTDRLYVECRIFAREVGEMFGQSSVLMDFTHEARAEFVETLTTERAVA